MERDYTISCDSVEYEQALPFVIIMSFVYPFGTPILYLVLLSSKRSVLRIAREDRTEEQRQAVAHLAFIAGAYKEEYW